MAGPSPRQPLRWRLAAWARGWRRPPPLGDESVLVISDIHLGEDILTGGPTHLAGYIRSLNLHLTEFIAHHRRLADAPVAHPRGRADVPRRWHLVVNGDMFDFVKVSVAPQRGEVGQVAEELLQATARPTQQVLENTADNVVYKLQRILEIHRPMFREMARFLADGHRITIIEGNHDAEFYFPQVRQQLREELVRLARPHSPALAGSIAERLQFRSWFVAEAGYYHIEHGHQHDEFCSFEYNLAPLSDVASGTLATPLSHRPMPYFAELLGDFSTHDVNQWPWARIFAFLREMGWSNILVLARLYLWVGWGLIRDARGERRRRRHLWRSRHQDELFKLADEGVYPLAVLRRLDAIKATPAEWARGKMLHLFLFDRLMLLAAGVAATPWMVWSLGWRGVVLDAVVCGLGLLVMSMGHRQEIGDVLRRAAAQVADICGARFVIFGHSHQPEHVDLRQTYRVGRFGARPSYLNSGSWVTREILRGDEGRGMTYVMLEGGKGRLMRWQGPKRPPREISVGR